MFGDWSDKERRAAFIAGQEQLARDEAEFKERVAKEEQRKAEAAQREIENRGYDMSHTTKQETPMQRLHRANMAMSIEFNAKEAPLTQAERGGLTEAEFLALSPERRLAIAHAATDARKRNALKQKV